MLAWMALAAAADPAVPPVAMKIVAPERAPADKPFDVAVVLDVPAGWHVYWENPGQSGLATDVALRLDGAPVAGPDWPAPVRFDADGIVNYGYTGPTGFVFRVPAAAAGKHTLTADATWLLCKDICVRGEGTAKLALRADAKSAASDPAAPYRAKVPRPFAESGGAATLAGGKLTVRLPGPGPFAVFPTVALESAWTPTTREEGGAWLLETPFVNTPGAALVVTRGPSREAFRLDVTALVEATP